MYKKILLVLCLFAISFLISFSALNYRQSDRINDSGEKGTEPQKPLLVYSIENLAKISVQKGNFEITEVFNDGDNFTTYNFEFEFSPNPSKFEVKKTTGLINIPKNETDIDTKYPAVLMLRGYVDKTIYAPGAGSANASRYFAENGFITISPDFLGYGGSDTESSDIFEARFQTYVTVASLVNSIEQITKWDNSNLFLWGHSNGGQIAIATLEITGKNIPTVLWAPVSKYFPYSVLYYTDESPDRGKYLRSELSKFESLYDTEKYSTDNFLELIKAPIQIHQGGADKAVPLDWTTEFVSILTNLEIETEYFIYAQADHNLRPDWNTAVSRSLEFYQRHLN
jgi:uncharacterized protein